MGIDNFQEDNSESSTSSDDSSSDEDDKSLDNVWEAVMSNDKRIEELEEEVETVKNAMTQLMKEVKDD